MPFYSDKSIETIKSRILMSDVARDYAPVITRSGKSWLKCPFHGGGNERTPSCLIDDTKGRYHCFACGESGDIFTFIMKMENLDFSEAVEKLALRAGVELESQRGVKKDRGKTDAIFAANKEASEYFSNMLSSEKGFAARKELDKRKTNSETAKKFSLGYAPADSTALYNHLKSMGYSDDILKETGLFSKNYFPKSLFSDRLMFPVRDRLGRVIAFSGRDLSGHQNAPKYINSPDTEVYSKKMNLFGIYESNEQLRKEGSVAVLVEGNFDVVSMHQAGIKTALAPLGTAFTEEQAKLIAKYTSRVDLMFDSDEAGDKSTDRAILILNNNNLEVRVHNLKTGKDASEVLEKGGPEALLGDFRPSESAFDFLVRKGFGRFNLKSARGKAELVRYLKPFISGTSSDVERDDYIMSVASLIDVSPDAVRRDLSFQGGAGITDKSALGEYKRNTVSIDLFSVLYLANHRDLYRAYRNRIRFADLKDNDAKSIYSALENAMREEVRSDEVFLSYINDERARNLVSVSYALDEYAQENNEALEEAADRISLRSMEESRDLISKQIRMYSDVSEDEFRDMMSRKSELDKKINQLKSELRKRSLSGTEV